MRSFSFDGEFEYEGHKVVVPVSVLMDNGVTVDIEAVLDTGASISILSRTVAKRIGLTIETGEPLDIMAVSGDVTTAFIHNVDINFRGRRLAIRAAVCPDWKTRNFLGMNGFLDQLVVAFDHAQHRIYY
jgi:predicted aspartyl protease